MKLLYATLLMLILVTVGYTQSTTKNQSTNQSQNIQQSITRQNKKLFVASSSTYWAGALTDIVTSQNRLERNPILRGQNGRINTTKAVAVNAGVYAFTLLLDKTHHSKLANTLRFTLGGMHFGLAAYNSTVPRIR